MPTKTNMAIHMVSSLARTKETGRTRDGRHCARSAISTSKARDALCIARARSAVVAADIARRRRVGEARAIFARRTDDAGASGALVARRARGVGDHLGVGRGRCACTREKAGEGGERKRWVNARGEGEG